MISRGQLEALENQSPPRQEGDPIGAFNWVENVSRQSGRTTELVRHLPKDGKCVVVVSKLVMKENILALIAHQRPDIDISKIKWVSADTLDKAEQKVAEATAGVSDIPIFFDHVFFYIVDQRFVKRINALYSHLTPQETDADYLDRLKTKLPMEMSDIERVARIVEYLRGDRI